MFNPKEHFYCYNPKLQNFLIENGCKIKGTGTNDKTGKVFLCFRKSEDLERLMKEYQNNK